MQSFWDWGTEFFQRKITSETITILEAYKKEITDSHELQVVSSIGESNAYFLRNCGTVGFSEQLDFRWVKKGKVKASITFAVSENLEAISIPQSPFGGIFIDENLSTA